MRKWLAFAAGIMILAMMVSACTKPAAPADTQPAPGAAAPAPAPAEPAPAAPTTSRLDTVLARGKLICGVNGSLPGFSFVDSAGNYAGLDADFCRAVAAALFDNPNAVEFKNLSTTDRFTATQTGDVDVLMRNTTWTISRDTSVGMEFAPTTFYDGQGMMVRKDSGITRLEDMAGTTVCVQTGTTTEKNLSDQMRKRSVNYEPLVFDDIDQTYSQYDEGRCDGVTSDRSQLSSRRTTMKNPDDHVILDVVMSKEPLGPAVTNGDSKWFDAVKWVVYATIEAEELGINSANVDQMRSSEDPVVKRLLGLQDELGAGLGISNDFAYRVIKHVGNYGEIYDRNVGPSTPLRLDRGPNKLWTEGGLMYSPPFR